MFSSADLPNDIDALKALLLASARLVRERDATIATQSDALLNMQAQLTTRTAEIEHLKLQIAKLRRMQFGRKSEKLDHQIEQLKLQLEDLQADDAEAERAMPAARTTQIVAGAPATRRENALATVRRLPGMRRGAASTGRGRGRTA